MNEYKKGDKLWSRGATQQGTLTGSTHRCQLEGCCGVRVTVKWASGKVTHPCSKGLGLHTDGVLIIL